MLETNSEEYYLVAQRTVFERFSQGSGIPKVDITKAVFERAFLKQFKQKTMSVRLLGGNVEKKERKIVRK